jgi:hypothetical protein
MALSILDGNQSATTLSTIVTSGQHIPAHTVVSLGTQAITDVRSAVSGSVVSISNTVTIAGTVTANPTGTQTIAGTVTAIAGTGFAFAVQNGISDFVSDASFFPISGTVTSNLSSVRTLGQNGNSGGVLVYGSSSAGNCYPIPLAGDGSLQVYASRDIINDDFRYIPLNDGASAVFAEITSLPAISGTVTIGSALPSGTNRIGVVTIGGGTVTIGAGTAQIGSVTASISNSVTISSLPALVAGTAQIGSVTASISNSVVTFYPMQGTTVTNSNFTSTTASTTLVSAVAGREVLTVFNEGAGNLHISPGATCTTVAYQVRLSAGDYWECPQGQLSLAYTAVFATAGTARVTEVS